MAMALVPAVLLSSLAQAATPTRQTYSAINPIPPNAQSTAPLPLIMLNMSKDHQLFYRAYNEFSDYNGDGIPDGRYLHTVSYAGYFDSRKCYTYDAVKKQFNPSAEVSGTNLCSGAWHGNFLNWATMTRMDVLRKVLYGGYRSIDTNELTVLERASLPMDAHSFAKYYANAGTATPDQPNISSITPFHGTTELTFCNTTLGDNSTMSQTNTNPPLLRATSGNYSLWNAHERRQCRWNEELQWEQDGSDNGNDSKVTGLAAAKGYPSRSTALPGGVEGDFHVRVQVCAPGLIGSERCRAYPAGNRKPIGLLQEYGEQNLAEFGLLTGSFSNNTSGGVLRKEAGSFQNEVNYKPGDPADSRSVKKANGSFVAGASGIVDTINKIKVYGYRYKDGLYDADGDCKFQLTSLSDGKCASWGNPIGEMFVETLRYLSGLSGAASAYGGGSDAKGKEMGLPALSTWTDPFGREGVEAVFGRPQCRPINVINFNASVTSYDRDTLGPFATLGAAQSLDSYTDAVGQGEGIANTSRFIGRTPADANGMCTAKTVGNLSAVDGICPMAPAYQGSFSLAGAAYWARTNAIRTVPPGLAAEDAQRAYRVRSYGVALAPGVPRITVQASGGTAVIQPAYVLQIPNGGGVGSGTLVDFRVISQTATSGRYLVVWEDSEQGGDYDQDVSGILEWSLSGKTLTVTTRVITQSTFNAQGFGYVVSGTDRDGVHFHSGIHGFSYNEPALAKVKVTKADGTAHPHVNDSGGCSGCQAGQAPSMATYTVNGEAGSALQDPMWYAAKWGGFQDTKGIASGTPGATDLWDAINNTTGAVGPDGVPDNFFEVFNPSQLEQSLRRVFQEATVSSNAAPAVSSSQLIAGGLKYVGSFDPKRQNGDIRAFGLDGDGNFTSTVQWSVGAALTAKPVSGAGARQIITNSQATGFAFDWANVSSKRRAAYQSLLTQGSTTINAAQAQRVVQFVRGDRSDEGTHGLRNRDKNNIMGPLVNASPWVQPKPSARLLSAQHPGYAGFVAQHRNREKVLWAAAGDGMLHAFNARDGASIMSYVPEALVPRLNELATGSSVQAFVDGSPFTADVDTQAGVSAAPNWRTYVFGSLGRGGRALFALDATDLTTLGAAESNAERIFKWQFNADDDPDLGHLLGDIAIEPGTGQAAPVVKLQDGRFALVFGNGYGSQDGKAVLFIVPVQGPDSAGSWDGRYHKIVLDSGPGNGLSTATPLDTNNDGRADTVYAGDLKGNLWKIDIGGSTPRDWGSAYRSGGKAAPLYVATAADGTTPLPITGAPQFSFPSTGGTMVSFGTGLSVLSTDFPRASVGQRVYGIWDRPAFASGTRALPRGTGTLAARTLTRLPNGNVVVSNAAPLSLVDANASNAQDGWYFQLPGSSEMVLSNVEFRANNIFFSTVRPAPTTTCSNTPLASFYLLDPNSGLARLTVQGATAVNGVLTAVMAADVADQKLRVVSDSSSRRFPPAKGQQPAGSGPLACPKGTAAVRVIGEATDLSLCFPQSSARFQWREIPGLRTQ
jgi:type IV pilus assembly protein PilY1